MSEERTTPDPSHAAPAAKALWRRPELRRDEELDKEHKTSWLELFLDLVFVVVIDYVTHQLTDITLPALGEFCLYFIPVWWVWMGCTYYNDRFETDDVSHRLFTFLTILPLAGMAYSAGTRLELENASEIFSWCYVAARLVLIVMWLRAGWHSPEARPLTRLYAIGFSASVVVWVVSAFVPSPWRFVLWGAGLLIDLLTPLATLSAQARLPRLSTSHLPERFGLLTLIVLGECVNCVIQGLAGSDHHAHPSPISLAVAGQGALGLALCFSLWWIYFDHVMGRRSKPGVWWASAWAYAHLPLLVALTCVSVAVRSLVADEDMLSNPVRWLACGAMAVALLSLAFIEWTLRKDQRTPIHLLRLEVVRLAAAAVVLLLGLFGEALNPHPLLLFGILVGIAILLVIHGLYRLTQGPAGVPSEPRL